MRTEPKPRLILDTKVIISGVLFKGEAIRSLLLYPPNEYLLVFSKTTWDELASVFQRDAFEKIMPLGARLRVLPNWPVRWRSFKAPAPSRIAETLRTTSFFPWPLMPMPLRSTPATTT